MQKFINPATVTKMLLFYLILVYQVQSQETISGTVAADKTGVGIGGVSVLIKGTSLQTTTSGSGAFSLTYNAATVDQTIEAESFIPIKSISYSYTDEPAR